MKIGILTFHTPINYGAVLQAYALQKYLRSTYPNYDIANIDFKTDEHIKRYRIWLPLRKNIFKYLFDQSCVLRRYQALKERKERFRKFVEEEFNLTQRYETQEKLLSMIPSKDVYIVGSDQVFHPSSPYLRAYYLDFKKNKSKKIGYAPSFGMSEFSDTVKQKVTPYLIDFDTLSCREQDGAEFIGSILGKSVPVVMDPVFLLSKNEWASMSIEPQFNKEYIFIYDLNGNEHLIQIAKQIQKQTGLPIVCQTQNASKFYPVEHQLYNSGPREFIGLIKNAEYVVTDSFHGTAFSILFNKEQYIYNARPKASSRIYSIMSKFGLQDRIIEFGASKKFSFNLHAEKRNFDKQILEQEVSESKKFLHNAMH